MQKTFVLLLLSGITVIGNCQFPLLSANYSQDFNSLPGGIATMPVGGDLSVINSQLNGWYFYEMGSAGNLSISSGDGNISTGDTYQFGNTGINERSLGTLRSSVVNSILGFYFVNNSGQTITSIAISYTGEQWRLGTANRPDKLDVQYSLSATSVNSGIWVDAEPLDFNAPVSLPPTGALNGNNAGNRITVTSTIQGIKVHPGNTFFIRWVDYDASGSEDGLGIDDFSLNAGYTPMSNLYFRSIQNGLWDNPSSWQTSADFVSWNNATSIPSADADTVIIQSGTVISFASFLDVDEVVIEGDGTLNLLNGIMTVKDGWSDDIRILGNGLMIYSSPSNAPQFDSGSTLIIDSGGVIRVAANGHTTVAGAGIHSPHIVYGNGSVLEYNLTTPFGSNGIIYFPGVTPATIPVFRILNDITLPVGSTGTTTINGIIEVNGNISFNGSGSKIFRNGLKGNKNISSSGTGKFIINGQVAVLAGSGTINSPANGVEISAGSTVHVSDNKVLNGNIHLKGSGAVIRLEESSLIVSGIITNESALSYVRTSGTGMLTIINPLTGFTIPVGNSTYNPITVFNVNNGDLSVRVVDSVSSVALPGFAIRRTWELQCTGEHPDLRLNFQYNEDEAGPGLLPTDPMEILMNTGVWNIIPGNTNILPLAVTPDAYTVNSSSAIPVSSSSPLKYIIAKSGGHALPLTPVIKLFGKNDGGKLYLFWNINVPATAEFFYIEQYKNGKWESIANQIAEKSEMHYSFISQFFEDRQAQYRVRCELSREEFIYSNILSLVGNMKGEWLIIYPNPVTSDLVVSLNTGNPGIIIIEILDMQGRKIIGSKEYVVNGVNTFQYPLSLLPTGQYILRVKGIENYTISFLKN